MSRLTYWPLLAGCVVLVGLYAQPAWSIVRAGELPSSQSLDQLVQAPQRTEKASIVALPESETKQDVVASIDARP